MKLKEAYIKAEKGNIYYTKRGETLISLSKTIFLEKGLPVRVYYDINKDLYVFGNAFDYIHTELASGMKYYSKVYGIDEMRYNVSYVMENCALFQIIPNDDFKKYDMGDGYSKGWFLKLGDLIFACRNKEYEKVRDNVPLFKDHIGEWMDVEYYMAKKQGLSESVEYIEGVEVLINPSKQELNGFMKKNKVYRVLLTDNDMAIWTADCPLCHLDVEGEYPEFNNSEHLFALNGNLFFVDYDMKPEEIEDFYFEDAEKLDNLPIVKDYFPHSQMKKALEMMKNGISAFNVPNDWHGWLNESAEDKITFEPTNDSFVIGGKDFKEEDCDIYHICLNGKQIGYLALKEYPNYLSLEGIEFGEPYRNKGYGKQVVKMLKEKYGNIYVRSIPEAKGFWDKQGHKSSWNDDSGTFDGMLDESVLDDKTFYTKQLSRMLEICMNIGNARFIYISEAGLFVIGNAFNCTHMSLFLDALQEGEFDIRDMDIDEYFNEYIHSAEDTGAIITKEYANDNNIWMKSPDSTNVINDYGKFYLCNGLCIEDSLAELTNIKPKYVKYISYLNESVDDKILYLVRGLPGSGKSTLAKTLTKNVVEADQFLYDENGNYVWTQERVYKAHKQCQATVKKYMEEGRDKIAVANCFVKLRDMKPYKKLAEEFGYKVIIKVCKGNYGSIHNVSDETMDRMKNNFQLDESVKYLNKEHFDGYNEIVENENNIKYYFIGKCNDTDDGMEIQEITHWDEWGNSEYYGIPEDDESIEVIDTNAFLKMIGDQPKPEKIEYCAKNKDKDIIWAYDDEGIHWFYSQSGNELFESADNDKTLRDYAVKLANIVIDSIIEPKYKTTLTTNSLEINVDKAFKKAVPILKKSPLIYYVVLCSYEDEKHANYGISTDGKYGLITLPILPDNPVKILTNLLSKHRKYLDKLSQQYTGKEFMDKVNESAIRWLKQILKKSSDFYRNNYIDALTHECTHAIDGVRRTNTFKHRKQDLETEKGIKNYYNSSVEQNAYYQETIALFDKWAEESVRYKKFDHFMDDFKRQYRGEWNLLNNINKRKIMRRAYAYWELYMKD